MGQYYTDKELIHIYLPGDVGQIDMRELVTVFTVLSINQNISNIKSHCNNKCTNTRSSRKRSDHLLSVRSFARSPVNSSVFVYLFSRTIRSILTKLGIWHFYKKENLICQNKSPNPFLRGINHICENWVGVSFSPQTKCWNTRGVETRKGLKLKWTCIN